MIQIPWKDHLLPTVFPVKTYVCLYVCTLLIIIMVKWKSKQLTYKNVGNIVLDMIINTIGKFHVK